MTRERDIAYGRHSNIPECCIMFFVDEWDFTKRTKHRKLLWESSPRWNYVPCPKCLKENRRAHLRMCEAECGKKCWLEFK